MATCSLGMLVIIGIAALGDEPAKPSLPGIRVVCHGKLRHGVVAIGGETTGTTIAVDRLTWELKLSDEASRAFAAAHHKMPVVATGRLRRVGGTQIPVRWIVDVEQIAEQERGQEKTVAVATVVGKLQAAETVADQTPSIVIAADGIALPLDLSHDPAFPGRAKTLLGKSVAVHGSIERVGGSETPPRIIIRVGKLDSAGQQ